LCAPPWTEDRPVGCPATTQGRPLVRKWRAGRGEGGAEKRVGESRRGARRGAPIEVRPGFAALLDCIEGNGVRTVVVGRKPVRP
jgi:hypothetical protein